MRIRVLGARAGTEDCMSTTDKNLKEAFRDECETYMLYLAFARQAADENLPAIARLFRAMAEGERIHALNQIDALQEVQSTEENLERAAAEEEGDFFTMYPHFIKEAQAEDRTDAVLSLTWIQQAEKAHFAILRDALRNFKKTGDIEKEEYHLCTNCGFVATGAAPSTCPVCKAPQSVFRCVP